jgi:membrane associated rhomboid family serine protease
VTPRFPGLTIAVFAVTAAFTTAQFLVPGLLEALRRQPSMITDGEIWRFVTTWLVHDEGIKQIGMNFPLLAIAGTLAEFTFRRRAWIAAYVLAGLTGEMAGVFWQPIGAGNSVAVLGLVGLVAGWWSRRSSVPAVPRAVMPIALLALAVWLIFIHDIHGPALAMGLLLGQIAARMPKLVRSETT